MISGGNVEKFMADLGAQFLAAHQPAIGERRVARPLLGDLHDRMRIADGP